MSTVCNLPAQNSPLAGKVRTPASHPHDGDDGIHIASVTRVDGPDGPVLHVVVAWFEEGRWVERTVELPDR